VNGSDDNDSGSNPASLLIAGWRIDTASHCMSRGADEQRLEPKVMELLQTLAGRPGEVFSRQELLERVWHGTVVGDDALTAAVIKIRKAFCDDARKPRVIQTVPKAGYRLIAEIGTPKPASEDAPGALAPLPEARGRRLSSTILCCLLDLDTGSDAPDDPEVWQSLAEGFAAVAHEAIAAQGGTVRRDSGALLGIFGAPLAVEHHAAHAVHAAVGLRNAYRAHRQRTRPEAMTALRMALASGAVVV
jgi:DNA-binding winged helix-turn-helix (wHTH) protein